MERGTRDMHKNIVSAHIPMGMDIQLCMYACIYVSV